MKTNLTYYFNNKLNKKNITKIIIVVISNVWDHASQPYSTTGNIIVLYILIFKFLEKSREDKSVLTEW